MSVIPPKPAAFTPEGAPAGVEIKFVSYWRTRQLITPRLQLVHTNASGSEVSLDGASRAAERNPGSATLPHYQVARAYNAQGFIARKMLPTNRKGIGNGTVLPGTDRWPELTAAQQASIRAHGAAALFSLLYETSDLGFGPGTPGEDNVFTEDQGEMLATILAYEAATHPEILLDYPDDWWLPGTACHTEPFTDPYWSIYRGKSCPGREKKRQVREWILPRARQILTAWLGGDNPIEHTPPEEDDMNISTLWVPEGEHQIEHQFVTGKDGALRHRARRDGIGQPDWENLGGQYLGDPTVVLQPDGKLAVFGQGLDGNIWKDVFEWGVGWTGHFLDGVWPG